MLICDYRVQANATGRLSVVMDAVNASSLVAVYFWPPPPLWPPYLFWQCYILWPPPPLRSSAATSSLTAVYFLALVYTLTDASSLAAVYFWVVVWGEDWE